MMVTHFRAPSSPEAKDTSSKGSSSKRSSVFLGVGYQGAVARDSASPVGWPRLTYNGAAVSLLYQPESRWLVRVGLSYVARDYGFMADPTGGFGMIGQYWNAGGSIEYQLIESGAFRFSAGWAHLVSFGFRGRDYLSNPSFGRVLYYKTGVSGLLRFAVSENVDLYIDGSWLTGIGWPWENQGMFGAGVKFGL